ncbi:MAG: (d)CMP kinase [Actinomycetota bacterium]
MSGPASRIPKTGTVVAIDGPAGVGKSTLARWLAEVLRLAYVNTGVMYRSVAHEALRRGIDAADGAEVAALAGAIEFSLDEAATPPVLLVNGRPPQEAALAHGDVEEIVSSVAAHPAVREVLREAQRRLGVAGAVVEGRDIGTVVFPDADVKIFLQADPIERATRRQTERGSVDPALAKALEKRDERDSRVNPLAPASDSVLVDTSGRSPDEVLAEVKGIIERALEDGSSR